MKNAFLLPLLLSLLLSASVLISCTHLPRGFEEPESKMVLPSNFLYSGNEALEEWLEVPFKVRYREATIEEVLRSQPFYGISYRLEEMPDLGDEELLNIDSPGMTRRQLLWSVARAYDLDMHVEYQQGLPSTIVVMGNPEPLVRSITVY